MLNLLKLFLPVFIPSWRFFSSVGPSPRIEFAFLVRPDQEPHEWQPLLWLPLQLTWRQAIWRFLHNPAWNEQLYFNTCAEQLFEGYSAYHANEIGRRLVCKVLRGDIVAPASATSIVYRLRAIHAYEALPMGVQPPREEITFVSPAFALKHDSNQHEIASC